MRSRRKAMGKVIIGVVIGAAMLGVILFVLFRPQDLLNNEVTVRKGNVEAYYSFSGNVEAKNRETIKSDQMMQIKEVKVAEGEQVKKDEVLFVNSFGGQIKAKMDGEVGKLNVGENDQVMAGTSLGEIVDYTHLQVTVKVDEYDMNALEVGKDVSVTINAIDKKVVGKISKISKEAVNANGISYFTAIIDLQNDPVLRVGMSAEVRLLSQSASGVIVIPMSAVHFDEENQPFVYMRESQGKAKDQPIQVGVNDGTMVEVKEGLIEGQIILVPKTGSTMKDLQGARKSATQRDSEGGAD